MKIAIVEKSPSALDYKELLSLNEIEKDFELDRFSLVDTQMKKVLKRDITLDFSKLDEYDYVILIGAETCKFIGKISSVTHYAGHLCNEKYIPMINPSMVMFKPEAEGLFTRAVNRMLSIFGHGYNISEGNYELLNSEEKILDYLKRVGGMDTPHIAVDTETTALYPRDGYVLGISISHKEGQGVYIVSDYISEKCEKELQKLFYKKKCIFHNFKFDAKMLEYHFGLEIPDWEDTLLIHYVLNENEEHGLKFLTMKYLNMGDYDRDLEEFKTKYCRTHNIKKKDFTYDLIPEDILYKYAAGDTDATLRLFNLFYPKLREIKSLRRVYSQLLKKGTTFLKQVEENGVPFDKRYIKDGLDNINDELFKLRQELYQFDAIHKCEQHLGKEFNTNSTPMLRTLFFSILDFKPLSKTPAGQPSTDKNFLEKAAESNNKYARIPELILKIRQKEKIKNTYLVKVKDNIDIDGRLRTNFNLAITTSGRLSSSGKLNAQQLPRDDKTVKLCIRPNPEFKENWKDYVIISQDLGTAEMYYAAVLSGDKNLQKVFVSGGDFHSTITKQVFGLSEPVELIKEKYGDYRQACKAISFGILYGAKAPKISQTMSESLKRPVSIDEAQEIIDRYFATYPKLKRWLDHTNQFIKKNGYITSFFGRKRRLPNVFSVDKQESESAVRSGLNFTIQSLSSDINLLAGIETQEELNESNLRVEIFGLVHDSILSVCHKDDVKEFTEILARNTQKDRGCSIPNCPIGLDIEIGSSYALTDQEQFEYLLTGEQ